MWDATPISGSKSQCMANPTTIWLGLFLLCALQQRGNAGCCIWCVGGKNGLMLVLVARHQCSCLDILRPCVEMRTQSCAICLLFPPIEKYHTTLRQQMYYRLLQKSINKWETLQMKSFLIAPLWALTKSVMEQSHHLPLTSHWSDGFLHICCEIPYSAHSCILTQQFMYPFAQINVNKSRFRLTKESDRKGWQNRKRMVLPSLFCQLYLAKK